ncbi:MAG: alpha/beta hydrolase fold domain-containing protein [Acutalibacteraceae bacterium]
MQKIIAFFMSIIAFIMSLLGLTPKTPGVTAYQDLAYGTVSSSQKLDLYLPERDDKNVGLIVFIHGGAWQSGDKKELADTAKSVTKNYGYATASLNYRMLGEKATYAEMLEDIHAALGFIKQKAEESGYSIKTCGLIGYSAGAHLALLYAYKNDTVSPISIAYVTSLAGPTDLTDPNFFDAEWKVQCGGALIGADGITLENWQDYKAELLKASPVSYVDQNVPKTLLCHGTADKTVPYSNAVILSEKLSAVGAAYTLIPFEGADHGLLDDSMEATDLFYQTFFEWSKTAFGY